MTYTTLKRYDCKCGNAPGSLWNADDRCPACQEAYHAAIWRPEGGVFDLIRESYNPLLGGGWMRRECK